MNRFKNIEVMLIASITFTFLLLVIRLFNTGTITYGFYVWNIFLAAIPLLFSKRLLLQRKLSFKSWGLLFGWLLFFPNAPYIITDLFHYTERPPMDKWFDLLIVTSAAWIGAGHCFVDAGRRIFTAVLEKDKSKCVCAGEFVVVQLWNLYRKVFEIQ